MQSAIEVNSAGGITGLLRRKVDDEVGDYGYGFPVAQAGRENPSGNDLNGLLLQSVSAGWEHRSFVDVAVSANDTLHLDVIPRSGACGDWLWRGLNDGAAVLLAGSEGGRIRRCQRVPVDRAIDDAKLLLDLHAQLAIDVVANVGREQHTLEGRKVGILD